MRFTLYTDKTVPQCMSALNQRLQAKPTSARPELNGWIEKGGTFSLSVTSRVAGRFPRTTRLTARAERESGTTIVRGHVSDGISPQWLRIVLVVVAVVGVGLVFVGEPFLALLTFVFGGIAYVPLRGDYVNSDVLLIEVERTLKATPKPPKKLKK
jgi:hypothetical protein